MSNDRDLDDANHYEVIDGVRVQMPPRSVGACLITTELVVEISVFATAHNLGEPVAFVLMRLPHATDAYRCRRPEISFVSFARWPAGRPMSLTAEAWDVVPDLAVQVISPNDLAEELVCKIGEYFQAGVRLVWVVFPTHRIVYVYDRFNRVQVLTESDTLDGGNVLPGFRLRLDRLFNQIGPSRGET